MVDSRFAMRVRRLAREDLTVAEIAVRMHCEEAEVMAAVCMLRLPLPGEHHDVRQEQPRDAEIMDRIPKKWQDHYGRDPEKR